MKQITEKEVKEILKYLPWGVLPRHGSLKEFIINKTIKNLKNAGLIKNTLFLNFPSEV